MAVSESHDPLGRILQLIALSSDPQGPLQGLGAELRGAVDVTTFEPFNLGNLLGFHMESMVIMVMFMIFHGDFIRLHQL